MTRTINYTKTGKVAKTAMKTHKTFGGFSIGFAQLIMVAGVITTIAYCMGHMGS